MPMPKIQWTEDMDKAIRENWHLPLSVISDIVGVSRSAMRGHLPKLTLVERDYKSVRKAAQMEYGRI